MLVLICVTVFDLGDSGKLVHTELICPERCPSKSKTVFLLKKFLQELHVAFKAADATRTNLVNEQHEIAKKRGPEKRADYHVKRSWMLVGKFGFNNLRRSIALIFL